MIARTDKDWRGSDWAKAAQPAVAAAQTGSLVQGGAGEVGSGQTSKA